MKKLLALLLVIPSMALCMDHCDCTSKEAQEADQAVHLFIFTQAEQEIMKNDAAHTMLAPVENKKKRVPNIRIPMQKFRAELSTRKNLLEKARHETTRRLAKRLLAQLHQEFTAFVSKFNAHPERKATDAKIVADLLARMYQAQTQDYNLNPAIVRRLF